MVGPFLEFLTARLLNNTQNPRVCGCPEKRTVRDSEWIYNLSASRQQDMNSLTIYR